MNLNVDIDDNEKELLRCLFDAYNNSPTLGVNRNELINKENIIHSLLKKKLAAHASEIFSLTMFGLAYCNFEL
jgi:hypothetical protein